MAAVGAVASTALSLYASAAEPLAPGTVVSTLSLALDKGTPGRNTKSTIPEEKRVDLFTPPLQHGVFSKDAPGNKLHHLECLSATQPFLLSTGCLISLSSADLLFISTELSPVASSSHCSLLSNCRPLPVLCPPLS